MKVGAGKPKPGRIIRLVAGWVLTVAGLILGPVPIVPGFVLLVPGIAILCAESRWLRRLFRRYREQRLMKTALREAERVGLKIDLDADCGGEDEESEPPDGALGGAG